MPSYFYIQFQLEVYRQKLGGQDALDEMERIESEFVLANDISDQILDTKSYMESSAVIDVILEAAKEGIDIRSIAVEKDDEQIENVAVSGIAVDRQSLITFRDAMEAHEYFTNIDFPYSNLAKNKDIDFRLTLPASEILQTALWARN